MALWSQDYRKPCHLCSFEWGKCNTNEAPPSEQKSQSLIGKVPVAIETVSVLRHSLTFPFMHLADAFIQSDLLDAFRLYFYCQYMCTLTLV